MRIQLKGVYALSKNKQIYIIHNEQFHLKNV